METALRALVGDLVVRTETGSRLVSLVAFGVVMASVIGAAWILWAGVEGAMREQERLLRDIEEELRVLGERLDLLEERVAPAWVTVTRVEKRQGVSYRLLRDTSFPPYLVVVAAMEEADQDYPLLGWSSMWTDNRSGRAILSFLGGSDEDCPGDQIICGGGSVEYDSKFYEVYVIIQLEPPEVG